MSLDGDAGQTTWVLAAGVNGAEHGKTTGTAYWTGEWDGEAFTAKAAEPAWLDHGADFYATVTWDDPRLPEAERLAKRYAIGWLNNWAYAGDLPTEDWHGGSDSLVRELELRTVDGRPTLVSSPVAALSRPGRQGADRARRGRAERWRSRSSRSPPPTPTAFASRSRPTGATRPSEVRFRVKDGGWLVRQPSVSTSPRASSSSHAMRMPRPRRLPEVYRQVRTAPAAVRDGVVTLDIIVDASSVEVFVNDGEAVISNLVFGAPGANGLAVESVGGTTDLRMLRLAPLAVAPVERLD